MSNYNDIKKVYSIWICMNMSENSMNHDPFENDTDYRKSKLERKRRLDKYRYDRVDKKKHLPEKRNMNCTAS